MTPPTGTTEIHTPSHPRNRLTFCRRNNLTTRDLGECHGIVSTVRLDDREVSAYRYVVRQDYPPPVADPS
ncbi:hypothetical protein FZI91_05700 [Mycobacterium sp. CBMA271]|nr:hypothetical protein [Mycobacteroides sp. CBMA 271]